MTFQFNALPAEPFAGYFTLSDAELAAQNGVRKVVTESPGVPCRVSLADAEVGETVVLVNYQHQPGNSPYQSTHAVYVREGVAQANLAVGEVPEVVRSRLMSVRGFDAAHMMIFADVVQGETLEDALPEIFADQNIAYVHLHIAKPGCFAASVVRA